MLSKYASKELISTVVAMFAVTNSVAATPRPLPGQQLPVRTVTISQRNAVSHDGFTDVVGVRELTGGGLLVLDAGEASLYQLGPDLQRVQVVGRSGAGPGEYLMPTSLLALGGDSSAIRDAANNRILVIEPGAGSFGVLNLQGGEIGSAMTESRDIRVEASDAVGHYYTQRAPIAASLDGRMQLIDSAAIVRWTARTSDFDTIAFLPVRHRPGSQVVAGFVARPARANPFATSPQWAVSRDGWTAIVHDSPYYVRVIDPTGVERSGAAVQVDRVRVSNKHKEAWCEDRERPRPLMIGSLTGGGAPSVVMRTSQCRVPAQWPEYLPPFLPNSVQFAHDGTIWVQRTGNLSDDILFDIFDRTGARVASAKAPPGRKLVGFGRQSMYLAYRDEVDLQYIERYRIPN